MTQITDTNKIPKRFLNLKKSFVENISLHNDHSFMSFPKGLNFHGKEQGEEVVLIIRSHWIVYIPEVFVTLLAWVLPWLLLPIIPNLGQNIPIFISILITSFVLGVSLSMNAFVRWFYNVSIITDQRVIDLDFPNVMEHSMSEAQLEKIEDITHKQIGAVGSLFDFGTVYIQTAGSAQNIEFQNVPRPRDVQDILVDLLESKQKGDI